MIKRAMILAAGFGKRVQPLTLEKPKPLLSIGKETLLSNTLKVLHNYGINEVIINIHYLGEQIIEYISKNKFDLNIKLINEKDKILDTGGGVLNAIKYFSNKPFFIINPDTIWNQYYIKELIMMEKLFLKNEKNQCLLLLVNKNKSFDTSFEGDFGLKDNLVKNKNKNNNQYIYTGIQIVKPEIFLEIKEKVFPIKKVWNKLILNKKLLGLESNINFLHVSTLDIYKDLSKKFFRH